MATKSRTPPSNFDRAAERVPDALREAAHRAIIVSEDFPSPPPPCFRRDQCA